MSGKLKDFNFNSTRNYFDHSTLKTELFLQTLKKIDNKPSSIPLKAAADVGEK